MNKILHHSPIVLGIMIFAFFLGACSKPQAPEPISKSTLPSLHSLNPMMASNGIGSGAIRFDFQDVRDLAAPMDLNLLCSPTGFGQDIICYRPGTGAVYIFYNNTTVGNPPNFVGGYARTNGIGPSGNNYNMNDNRDRIIPYDCDGTGKLDHLICYRPGTGAFWVFKYDDCKKNEFIPILKSSIGVGTPASHFDLSDSRDKIVPFDYYSTGKATQLLCYRPGGGICWIMNNTAAVGSTPNFVPVYQTSTGIGTPGYSNYDLSSSSDLIVPFDLNNSGKKDGIFCYRPGAGIFYAYTHTVTGGFQIPAAGKSTDGIYDPASNIEYDLTSAFDRLTPYDFYSNGATNNLVAYRPGNSICYMYANMPGFEGPLVYQSTRGIGSGSTFFDLSSTNDKVFAYDYDGSGKIDHLVCYRPGPGAFWIFNNSLAKIY